MKINTVIFYLDESPETDSSISSLLFFNYSVRKKQHLGRVVIAPEISPSLIILFLFIYDFINTDRRDQWHCGAVRNHLILVKCGFNCADWTAAVIRVLF